MSAVPLAPMTEYIVAVPAGAFVAAATDQPSPAIAVEFTSRDVLGPPFCFLPPKNGDSLQVRWARVCERENGQRADGETRDRGTCLAA